MNKYKNSYTEKKEGKTISKEEMEFLAYKRLKAIQRIIYLLCALAWLGIGPMSILWTKKVERLCSFFEFLILLLLGCYVTNRTVYSFSVIPALYVFKNCSAGFR